jgi:DNA-binding FadR family transcriptional regulator
VLSRQRAGATVRPRSEWHLLDPDVLYWLIQTQPPAVFVETLMTVRRVFEPAAAALAAKVASDEDLRGISAAYAGMESAQTAEDILEPDLAFHRRIAEATNNPLLAYIGNMLSRRCASRSSWSGRCRTRTRCAGRLPGHRWHYRDPLAAQRRRWSSSRRPAKI